MPWPTPGISPRTRYFFISCRSRTIEAIRQEVDARFKALRDEVVIETVKTVLGEIFAGTEDEMIRELDDFTMTLEAWKHALVTELQELRSMVAKSRTEAKIVTTSEMATLVDDLNTELIAFLQKTPTGREASAQELKDLFMQRLEALFDRARKKEDECRVLSVKERLRSDLRDIYYTIIDHYVNQITDELLASQDAAVLRTYLESTQFRQLPEAFTCAVERADSKLLSDEAITDFIDYTPFVDKLMVSGSEARAKAVTELKAAFEEWLVKQLDEEPKQ